jgi:hypothetical protein
MKTLLALVAVISLGVMMATRSPQIVALFQGKSMTYDELYSKTVDAFGEVPFLQRVPCSIDADYRYSACFVRDEGRGQNDLNAILPKLLEQRGIQLSGIESGESTSGGAAFVPRLNYRVDIIINEYVVSLALRGNEAGLFYLGGLLSEDRKTELKPYAYKSLRDASRDIAMRLVGSAEATRNRVECQTSSEHAYCAFTKASPKTILSAISDQFNFTGRKIMAAGYAVGKFDVERKDESDGFSFVRISYRKKKNVDEYTLWLVDYKRKNFTIIYTPASSKDKNLLRVEASWVDGYTPSPEEK